MVIFPPRKGQESFEADVVPENPMESDCVDKDESPGDFLLVIKPMWHLSTFASTAITEKSGNQVLPTHFDHEQIILISLFESTLGSS